MTAHPHFLAGGGEIGALMRAKSWSDTPLGAPETWPEALKLTVSICLNSRFPISLWWGPELVMFYNDAWRPILGKTKHPAGLGRPGIESWPEIWDIISQQFTSVMTRGEATWSDDLLLVLERNNYREEGYFTYSYSPIKNSDGSIGGVFSAITETTERVLGERRLRILRELAAQTAESKSVQAACETFARVLGAGNPDLPFAILYLLDEDGTSASLLAKTKIDDVFAPTALRLDHDDPWGAARVIREGDVIVLNDLAVHFPTLPGSTWPEPATSAIVLPVAKPGQKGGTTGALVAGINPRRALDDAYRGFFDLVAGHLATAVSNARAYEEERKRAEALAEINRAKTQFFSNVSHEFRTPLTLMLGPLEEVLAKPETNPLSDDRSLVSLAHRNGVRLLKLVNTLLDFSRIEAGRMQASFHPIDLAVFTAELGSNFRSAIERAGLRLVIDCTSLPHQVYVDADMWEKVVLNLISNAFKFTFEGEIAIAIKPSSDGRYAEVTVRDTGTGVPPEELAHLFERFHRVEGARGRSIEGSGIGLALVQELVKLHGGTIRVTSEVGKGSAFTVVIPFGVGHLPADRIGRGRAAATTNVRPQAYVEEALGWVSEIGTVAPEPLPAPSSDELGAVPAITGTEGQLVLVADDNADMRNYVQRLLRASGFRVETVTDGKTALAAARRLKPDLVLSDVMMPELDGFGLLSAIRKDAELRDTPVLLLSARAGEEAKVEGLSAGADDYLIKPFSARELLARVCVKLQLARTRRERSERELRQILDLAPLHITEFGPDGSHLYKNQAGLDYHGLTREEWQRADLQTLCHPHDAEFLTHELPSRFLSGSAFEHEMRLKRRDGQYRWFVVHFSPMVDEHGRPTRWYAGATDIEDRKRAEQLQADLAHVNRVSTIAELAASLAHEIKQPIGAALTNAESCARLLDRDQPDLLEAREAALEMTKDATRAAHIIDRVRSLYRKGSSRMNLVEVNEVIGEMLIILRNEANRHSLNIRTDLAEGLPKVMADRVQLQQVLMNLMLNGIQAMEETGGVLTIKSQLDQDGRVLILVSDTGVGLPSDKAEQIFEAFFTTKPEGSGMGLAISRSIIESHGGRLWATANPSRGATFHFTLPNAAIARSSSVA